MAFSDPIDITYSGGTVHMYRVQDNQLASVYQNDDRTLRLTISHQPGKGVTRRMVRLDQTKIAADPISTVNKSVNAGVYLVIEDPDFGFTDSDVTTLEAALGSILVSGTFTKLLRDEH